MSESDVRCAIHCFLTQEVLHDAIRLRAAGIVVRLDSTDEKDSGFRCGHRAAATRRFGQGPTRGGYARLTDEGTAHGGRLHRRIEGRTGTRRQEPEVDADHERRR